MNDDIPAGFPDWLTRWVIGHYLEGIPKDIRSAADAWAQAAERLAVTLDDLERLAVSRAATAIQGRTGDAIRKHVDTEIRNTRSQIEVSNAVATLLYDIANSIELQQYIVKGIAAALLANVLINIAAPMKNISDRISADIAANTATRDACTWILQRVTLFAEQFPNMALALRATITGALFMGVPIAGAQYAQIVQGEGKPTHRTHMNWGEVGAASLIGSVAGLAGFAGFRIAVPTLTGLGAERTLANVLAIPIAGAAGGVGAAYFTESFTGQSVNKAEAIGMGVAGSAVMGLGAVIRAARASSAATTPHELPSRLASEPVARTEHSLPGRKAEHSLPGQKSAHANDGHAPRPHEETIAEINQIGERAVVRPDDYTGPGREAAIKYANERAETSSGLGRYKEVSIADLQRMADAEALHQLTGGSHGERGSSPNPGTTRPPDSPHSPPSSPASPGNAPTTARDSRAWDAIFTQTHQGVGASTRTDGAVAPTGLSPSPSHHIPKAEFHNSQPGSGQMSLSGIVIHADPHAAGGASNQAPGSVLTLNPPSHADKSTHIATTADLGPTGNRLTITVEPTVSQEGPLPANRGGGPRATGSGGGHAEPLSADGEPPLVDVGSIDNLNPSTGNTPAAPTSPGKPGTPASAPHATANATPHVIPDTKPTATQTNPEAGPTVTAPATGKPPAIAQANPPQLQAVTPTATAHAYGAGATAPAGSAPPVVPPIAPNHTTGPNTPAAQSGSLPTSSGTVAVPTTHPAGPNNALPIAGAAAAAAAAHPGNVQNSPAVQAISPEPAAGSVAPNVSAPRNANDVSWTSPPSPATSAEQADDRDPGNPEEFPDRIGTVVESPMPALVPAQPQVDEFPDKRPEEFVKPPGTTYNPRPGEPEPPDGPSKSTIPIIEHPSTEALPKSIPAVPLPDRPQTPSRDTPLPGDSPTRDRQNPSPAANPVLPQHHPNTVTPHLPAESDRPNEIDPLPKYATYPDPRTPGAPQPIPNADTPFDPHSTSYLPDPAIRPTTGGLPPTAPAEPPPSVTPVRPSPMMGGNGPENPRKKQPPETPPTPQPLATPPSAQPPPCKRPRKRPQPQSLPPVMGSTNVPEPAPHPGQPEPSGDRAQSEPDQDSGQMAQARNAIRESLDTDADVAAAEAMIEALLRTAEGTAVISWRHSGTGPTRALRVEVVDQSQMPSVRDLPDEDTGLVESTDSGRVTELLDTSREWGFRLDTVNGSRTRWFEIATSTGQPDPSQATPEPVFRLPLPRGQIEHNVQRARNEVAEFLRRATRLDEGTIASAVLAVSEFAGNAATYADESGAEISVSFGEGRVQIGVTDGSRGLPTSRPEGHVDRSDQVEASPTVDKAEQNRLLAEFDTAASESDGFDLSAADPAPSEPGRPAQPEPAEPAPSETEEPAPFSMRDRAVGEHGRGFAIVMAEAVAYGVDLAPNGQAGKKVWVEYRLPPTPAGAHPDETAAAAVRSLLANAGDLDPDLTLVFHPASTSEGLGTPEHVATVAAAVGDMMRERGWRDPNQIEAATELVRQAGLNAIAYMERYADLMREADVRQSELDTALRDMTASLTLRMCTDANSRSLHVSVEVNQHRPERDPRIVTLTWPAPLFSHDQIGAAVRAPLGSATESNVEQWGEVWARFDEPSSDKSDIAVTEPPPHTDLHAKARIVRKLYVEHHIRVLGWENPDVPVWAVDSVDRALRDRMAELGGRFALRHVRFGEINAEYGLTESFGTTTSDAKDHYSCITLSTGMFTDPEVARRWEQRQSSHFLARSPEDMVYQTTHHEFLHVVAGDSDWMLHDEAPAMLRAAYRLYAAEGLLPGIGFDEWLALLPDYVFVNANPRTQTFDPVEGMPEGARAGAVESSLPLTDPARILHWLTVTRDGSSPAQTFARWAKMQAAGDLDGRELSLLLQDFADVTGRADIVTTAHPRAGRTTGDVLEAVTGGQLQPFTSTGEIHAQLRNWLRSLASEADRHSHGMSALVVEPPSPGQPDGRAYLLVRRVTGEESVRIELRNPATGVLLANHVPTIGSPELPGALAMFFDPSGAPVRPETVGAGQTRRREARGAMPMGAAEIAAALGIGERQAQDLADPAVKLPPGGLPLGVITRFGPGDAGHPNDPGPNQPPDHTAAPLTPPTTAADAPPVGSREWLAAQLRQAANGVQERAWNTLVEQTANMPFGVEEVLSGEYRRYLDDPDKLAEFTAATSGLGFTERLSLVAVLEQAAAKHRAAGLPISVSSGSHTANVIPVIAAPENLDPVAAGLLIADVIEAQLLGKQAIWASGKLHADFHEFDRWALTSAQGSKPPGLSPKIVMNCIKLPLYASALGHVIDHSYLQSYIRFESWNNATVAAADGPDFTWLDGTEIYEEEIEQHSRLCRLALAPHDTREYRADDPNTPLPNRGDLVYVYELSHVAVATGELGPDGSPALFTFWPYTSWPRAETVRISTVNAELAALTDAKMQSTARNDPVKVTFGPGPWGRGGTKYQPELEEWLRRHPSATPAEPETPTNETGAPPPQTKASSPWSNPRSSTTHTRSAAPENNAPPSHGAQQGARPAAQAEGNRTSGPTPWNRAAPGPTPGAPPTPTAHTDSRSPAGPPAGRDTPAFADSAAVELSVEPDADLIRHVLPAEVHTTEIVGHEHRPTLNLRRCIERALGDVGLADVSIPIGPNGEPRWPSELVMATTQTTDYTGVAITTAGTIRAIGLDAKNHVAVPPDRMLNTTLPQERSRMRALTDTHPTVHWDQVHASVKDNVLDLCFRLTGHPLRHNQVEVVLAPGADVETGTFEARLPVGAPAVSDPSLSTLSGGFHIHDGMVVTGITLRHPGDAVEGERGETGGDQRENPGLVGEEPHPAPFVLDVDQGRSARGDSNTAIPWRSSPQGIIGPDGLNPAIFHHHHRTVNRATPNKIGKSTMCPSLRRNPQMLRSLPPRRILPVSNQQEATRSHWVAWPAAARWRYGDTSLPPHLSPSASAPSRPGPSCSASSDVIGPGNCWTPSTKQPKRPGRSASTRESNPNDDKRTGLTSGTPSPPN
ncbi:hypothetical protein ACLMAJ_15880 [Nocardia sp. KC 131]|uniref:hypothetical protein n=1 Tax=Nocardia arseniciresistens TaxID=3392119 RepID=UPI00398E94CD